MRILLLGFAFIFTLIFPLGAETTELTSRENSFDRLNNLKKQLSGLLAENSRLEVEYSLLKQQFLDTSREYQSSVAELSQVKAREQKQLELSKDRQRQLQEMSKGLPDAESGALLLKSQVALLNKQLLDEEDKTRLMALKLADMEYEKRSLLLERQAGDFSRKTETVDQSQRLADLKQLYEKNLEREKEVLRLIDRTGEEGVDYDVTVLRLRTEIRDLQEQAGQLESRKKFKSEENALLRNKRLYEVRLTENQIWQSEQQRLALEKQVGQLEDEYQRLDQTVAASLVRQTRKRELLDRIIAIDRENQSLKNLIQDLESEVNLLR
jgi:hypothetical protein